MSDEPITASAPNGAHAADDKSGPPQGVSTAPYLGDEGAGDMIGPYKLLQRLGKGGMGVVWMAEQREPVHRNVAVKIIKAELRGDQVIARFEAERQALAMMDHPNIAKVLDAGTTAAGRPYFVMELVKGISFTQYCDQEKLPLKDRLELFIPVCNAVQHAHQKGVVHRDLKPSNVLIALYDGKPVPKVIDFGVAKATHQKLTEKTMFTGVGQIVGTLEYMAPEQAELNNLDIDTRADVYSLGVMLYELLTGAPPFSSKELRGGAFDEMLRIIREKEPSKPSTKISGSDQLPSIAAKRKLEPRSLARMVRGDLDWIVMKCLEKERTRRYDSANQLGEELRRYLCDEPVQAGPPSVSYRARKFVRRNRGGVIAAGLVLFVLIAGIISTSVAFVAAEQSASEERKAKVAAQESAKKEKDATQKALAAAADEKNARLAAQKAEAKALSSAAAETAARKDAEKAAELEKRATEQALASARAEEVARKAADNRLKHIVKANALLEGIFRDIDPRLEQKGGPLLSEQLAKRLLDTADKLDEDAIGDPLTVARLRNFLGSTLRGLGEPKKAIVLHAKALATRENLLDADHPDTLLTMNDLANAYRADGQLEKALPLYKETLARRIAKLGPDHADTLISMNNLATAYQAGGKLAKALPLLEETLAKRKATLGPQDPQTVISMNNLALAYQDDGQLAKAVPLYEEALARTRSNFGPDHPETLISMNNLALAYEGAGQRTKALPLYEATLAKRKAKLGPDHPDTLTSMAALAGAYQASGQLARAVPLFEETLAKRKSKLGPDHPHTLMSMNNLAYAYQLGGLSDKALPLFKEALTKMQAKLGPDHPTTLAVMGNLGKAYQASGQLDKALPVLEKTLAGQKAKVGPDHPHTLSTMNNLAFTYQADGQLAKALPLFEETLAKRKGALGLDHPDTLTSMNNLGMAYKADGQLAKALPLLEETLVKLKARLGPNHPNTLQSMTNLAYAYQADGQMAKALPLLEETLAITKARFGANHPGTIISLGNLALVYFDAKEPEKGAPLLKEYLAIKGKQWGRDDPRYADQLAHFAMNLLKNQQYALAEPMLRECLDIRAKKQSDAWFTFDTKSMLGGSLLGQKKYTDAGPFLKEGYEGMKSRAKMIPSQETPRLTAALELLVHFYEATGDQAAAERHRTELAERKAAEKTPKK